MIMTKLTALAALPLVATVVALLAFTSDTRADFLGDCPEVFTTQDVCYISMTDINNFTLKVADGDYDVINDGVSPSTGTNGDRILKVSDHGDTLAIYPVDGCSSFVGGVDAAMAKVNLQSAQACFAPLRFSAGAPGNVKNYCIQDNQAHSWQLCSTDDAPNASSTPAETQPTPPPASTNADWQRNCGSRSPGVYGTAANPLLCWGDRVGGDLGGDTDPWSTSWVTFTDCTPEGCRTYN